MNESKKLFFFVYKNIQSLIISIIIIYVPSFTLFFLSASLSLDREDSIYELIFFMSIFYILFMSIPTLLMFFLFFRREKKIFPLKKILILILLNFTYSIITITFIMFTVSVQNEYMIYIYIFMVLPVVFMYKLVN